MSLNDAENIVRLLGMSGFSLRSELRRVEKEHGIEVLPKNESAATDETYYPQFDAAVRGEASWMSEHYEVFYCLERSVRQLVEQVLRDAKGADWWNTSVPEQIKQNAKNNRDNEINEAITARSDRMIDYITFGELGQIITGNWAEFADLFNSQKAVTRVFKMLNMLRGPIAHCTPLPDDEIDRLRLALRDWFRLME